jgi:hypothetical protein
VRGAAAAADQDRLGLLEVRPVDDRRVGDLLGEQPLVLGVPPHLGGVAEHDVVDVEEDFVGALAVPDLVAGVAGVGQDGPYGALGPGDAAPVPVPRGVMGRRRRDTHPGQVLGNREDALAARERGEDHPHDLGGFRVDLQAVQPLAIRSLGRVGVRARVGEPVAVGRTPAEEPALELRLGGHGGTDADLDPVPLALRHPAEHGHNQVVGLVGGVDGSADLGHP